jgi:guanylate kinase
MTREEFLIQFPKLVKNYEPSPVALQRISNITLFMVIGPSGVGKTSIIKGMNIPYVASDITRPKRPEEVDGQDYYFRTDYDKLIYDIEHGGFVQVAIGPDGDFYGTRANSYPSFGMAVYSVVADVIPIFRELGFEKTFSLYIVPPNMAEWMHRMKGHNLSPPDLEKRMAEAQRSLKFALGDVQTHFILNDVLDDAITQANDLIGGRVNRVREEYAKQTADRLYKELTGATRG